jgi:hypothetical protein
LQGWSQVLSVVEKRCVNMIRLHELAMLHISVDI